MRFTYLASALGLILKYFGIVALVPIIVALIYQDSASIMPFFVTFLVSFISGFVLQNISHTVSKDDKLNDIKKSEALFVVFVAWLLIGIVASIPYHFYGLSTINSLFEAISGITTTGATILTRFDYPKTMFFWRSFTQWLGGMGIIVLFIAVLPQFAVAGRQMFFAEAPGPTEDKITPRIRHTATALWGIYFGLTIIEVVLLKCAGMGWFDSVCNSLSTLSAGGFSPNPNSIMGYNSNLINWIYIFFMFLSGASFTLQYKVVAQRNPLLFFKSEEFKAYLSLVVIFTLLVAGVLIVNHSYPIFQSITDSSFQVISLMTSTGAANADFSLWNVDAKILLFVVMFFGSCAGSAGSGIKIVRLILIGKYLKRELVKILHPNAVINIKLDNKIVPKEVIQQILAFSAFFVVIFVITGVLAALIEDDTVVGLSGAIATLGDIGPGFGRLDPISNYNFINPITKLIFIFNMLVGRLELIPFLVMLQPDFWSINWKSK